MFEALVIGRRLESFLHPVKNDFPWKDYLAQLIGEPVQEGSIERVLGGGNNKAFRYKCEGHDYFVKCYFRNPDDPRNRGQTEFNWSKVLWDLGEKSIPQPFGFFEKDSNQFGFFQFCEGEKVSRVSASSGDLVSAALDFILRINQYRDSPEVLKLPDASESCFTMKTHFEVVSRRVLRLQEAVREDESELHLKAKTFISDRIVPMWQRVVARSEPLSSLPLPFHFRILSPSDFGFHNLLARSDGTLLFFDFEYAGWDDPAKLFCDFFSQVAVPIPFDHRELFKSKIAGLVDEEFEERIKILFPLYQLKWVCILLNYFATTDAGRKKFAHSENQDWAGVLNDKLSEAQKKFDLIDF